MMGLVLADGEDSRLRLLTLIVPKHLILLARRAMIEYPIDHIVKAGVVDIGMVMGYLGHLFMEYLGDGSGFEARLRYVEQGETQTSWRELSVALSPFGVGSME